MDAWIGLSEKSVVKFHGGLTTTNHYREWNACHCCGWYSLLSAHTRSLDSWAQCPLVSMTVYFTEVSPFHPVQCPSPVHAMCQYPCCTSPLGRLSTYLYVFSCLCHPLCQRARYSPRGRIFVGNERVSANGWPHDVQNQFMKGRLHSTTICDNISLLSHWITEMSRTTHPLLEIWQMQPCVKLCIYACEFPAFSWFRVYLYDCTLGAHV